MSFILIGFKGVGKTRIGKLWAKRLGYAFCDTDELMLQDSGYASCAQLYRAVGEQAFRAAETRCLEQFNPPENSIIATGGGIVLQQRNYPLLHRLGQIIFLYQDLQASWLTYLALPECALYAEIRMRHQFEYFYQDRLASYAQWADHILDVSENSVADIVNQDFSLST